jgi:hypothetical protein
MNKLGAIECPCSVSLMRIVENKPIVEKVVEDGSRALNEKRRFKRNINS